MTPTPHPCRRQSHREKEAEPGSPAAKEGASLEVVRSHEEEMAGRLFDQMAAEAVQEEAEAGAEPSAEPVHKVATAHTSAFAKPQHDDLEELVLAAKGGARGGLLQPAPPTSSTNPHPHAAHGGGAAAASSEGCCLVLAERHPSPLSANSSRTRRPSGSNLTTPLRAARRSGRLLGPPEGEPAARVRSLRCGLFSLLCFSALFLCCVPLLCFSAVFLCCVSLLFLAPLTPCAPSPASFGFA